MSTLFPPFFQQVDSNGAPLSGGKLYFYQTGTSTPQDTYTSSTLGTPNANPVVADSNGRWGPIYLGTSADYKVILKDASDVAIKTLDPVFASGISGRVVVSDSSYSATVSDRVIAYTTLTGPRVVTLPAASDFPAGTPLLLVDESGSASTTNTLSFAPNGSDLINGANSTTLVISVAYGSAQIESNGDTKWTIVRKAAAPLAQTSARSYLSGLGTSNNSGTPNTKIDVAAGVCADDTNAQMLPLAATTLDCSGTGANGLDTGTLANSTWYHLFVIGKTDGTTALLASTSISAPTYPTGYTLKRRIGSFKTDGSAHILAFVQAGDEFLLVAQQNDVSGDTTLTTSAKLYTLASVPTGIKVRALVSILITGSGSTTVRFLSPDQTATAPTSQGVGGNLSIVSGTTGNAAAGSFSIRTNSSGQIQAIASAAISAVSIATEGWIDRRGRDA
jgi:hypothetical protein